MHHRSKHLVPKVGPAASRRAHSLSLYTRSAEGGKGKKGKQQNGTKATQSQKAEIHFLGGQGIDEVLFMEGWADGATQMYKAVVRGQVYRIAGAKKIDSVPRYSTSKLSYFLRFVPPIGVNTKIGIGIHVLWRIWHCTTPS